MRIYEVKWTTMDSHPPSRGSTSRKSSQVIVLAHNDIADIKVRKQSANLLAQQLQQQLILQQQQQQRSIRRDQVWWPSRLSGLVTLVPVIFSASCNIHLALMLRCQCPSVCPSVRLSVTEVYWRIIANLARSAKLPEGLYILPMFFRYFF